MSELTCWTPYTSVTLSEHDIRSAFQHLNTRWAAGSDCISGQILKLCADELAPVHSDNKPALG